jgi:hypothetical protein
MKCWYIQHAMLLEAASCHDMAAELMIYQSVDESVSDNLLVTLKTI